MWHLPEELIEKGNAHVVEYIQYKYVYQTDLEIDDLGLI